MKGHIITKASLFLAIVILVALLIGCSGSGSTNAPPAASAEVAEPAADGGDDAISLLTRYMEGFWRRDESPNWYYAFSTDENGSPRYCCEVWQSFDEPNYRQIVLAELQDETHLIVSRPTTDYSTGTEYPDKPEIVFTLDISELLKGGDTAVLRHTDTALEPETLTFLGKTREQAEAAQLEYAGVTEEQSALIAEMKPVMEAVGAYACETEFTGSTLDAVIETWHRLALAFTAITPEKDVSEDGTIFVSTDDAGRMALFLDPVFIEKNGLIEPDGNYAVYTDGGYRIRPTVCESCTAALSWVAADDGLLTFGLTVRSGGGLFEGARYLQGTMTELFDRTDPALGISDMYPLTAEAPAGA